jgi:redox-sensitive bicupin YhaK (pirin superfamily)
VTHSEFNASQTQTAHLLQIWILPAQAGGEPGYQQKFFDPTGQEGKLTLLVSPDGAEDSLTIKQDARIYRGLLNSGQSLSSSFSPKRSAWLQLAKGTLQVDDITLQQGDALALREEEHLTLHASTSAEFLLFDLP